MAARIPDTPVAFRSLRAALNSPIPGDRFAPASASRQKGIGAMVKNDANEQWCWSLDGMGFESFGPEYCVDSIFVDSERPPATEFELCAGDDLMCGGDSDTGDGYGLLHCFTDPHACFGGGTSVPSGCNGDPNAFIDDCGRCVGGITDREPATDGMDCDKICDYDNSFLNRMDVQAEIHRMWNASFGSNSSPLPPNQRNEAVTFVNLFANNEWEFDSKNWSDVSSCHINPPPGYRFNRGSLVAVLHTHPYAPGERIFDLRCYTNENDRRIARGQAPLSPGDRSYNAYTVSRGDQALTDFLKVPMYVIDREGVRKLDHNTFVPGERASYATTYNHCWD